MKQLRESFWLLVSGIADAFQVLGVQGVSAMLGSFAVPAYAAWATDWLRAWGPISWVACGFAGVLVLAMVLLVWSKYRLNAVTAELAIKLGAQSDAVNPLENVFHKKRIRIADLASPIDRRVARKTFTECELIGPANVVMLNGTSIRRNDLINCQFVVVRPDIPLMHVVGLDECTIERSKLYAVTFLVPPAMVHNVQEGATWITELPAQVNPG